MMFLQCFGILGLFLVMGALAQNKCPAGWFGTLCNMMCHCNNPLLCGANGECPKHERCRSPFFGPGCQYYDAYQRSANIVNHDYFNDNDDSTCNANSAASSFEDTFKEEFSFTWIRIVAKKSVVGLRVLMSYKYCDDPWLYYINERTVDYLCGNSFTNRKIGPHFKITGDLPPLICTINIAEGRNVALKQFVNMSSTNNVSGRGTNAELAVDGNKGTDPVKDGCAESAPINNQVFYLVFPTQVYIHKVHYYGYIHKLREDWRPYKIWIQGYNQFIKYSYIFNWKLERFRLGTTTIFQENEYFRIGYITIKEYGNKGNILSVCELEVYGEILCPPNKYGLDCTFDCTCCKNQLCNPITGACGLYPAEKNPPLHSCPNCQRNCCEPSGKCLEGCVAGFSGSYCLDACPAGSYGEKCSQICSPFCSQACHTVTGHCNCSIEHVAAPLCKDCKVGRFGPNCTSLCPSLCGVNHCDSLGVCNSCPGGRIGNYCESCVPGHYGATCTMKCRPTCMNNTCEPILGHCYGCMEGRVGEFCTLPQPEKDKDKEFDYSNLLSLAALLPVLCCLFCCLLGKKRAKETTLPEVTGPEEKRLSEEHLSQDGSSVDS